MIEIFFISTLTNENTNEFLVNEFLKSKDLNCKYINFVWLQFSRHSIGVAIVDL